MLNPDNYIGFRYAGAHISAEKFHWKKSITNDITGTVGVYVVRVSTANDESNILRIIKNRFFNSL